MRSQHYETTEAQLELAHERLKYVVLEIENSFPLDEHAHDLTAEDLRQLEQRIRLAAELVKLAGLYFDQEHRWRKERPL